LCWISRVPEDGEKVKVRHEWVAVGGRGENAEAWEADFGEAGSVEKHFEIDERPLYTFDSISCIRRDHVHIGVPLMASGARGAPPRGTLLVMDDSDPDCNHKAEISTGHLKGREQFLFGNFSFKIRLAHRLEDTQMRLSKVAREKVAPNAMSCVALYTNKTEHNEVSLCFRASKPKTLDLGFFLGTKTDGDKLHLKSQTMKDDMSDRFIDFGIAWSPGQVVFTIGNEVVWNPNYDVIPWEPMSIRIILRPFNIPSKYQGSAQMAIGSVAYVPHRPHK